MELTISPIGIIHSPFKQKFAIPRQPRLIKEAIGYLELLPPYADPEALTGLKEFSHLWLIFIFHQTMDRGWSARVRPPRLGGNKSMGVFATRSTFRPNPIGMSAVENLGYRFEGDRLLIELGGIDLLDGTPVLDIKPYVPYADSIKNAKAGFATEPPTAEMIVKFEPETQRQCQQLEQRYPQITQLISEVIAQDPRPAYKKALSGTQEYAVFLHEINVKWRVESNTSWVFSIEETKQ